ncbi:MAG TPA: SDR family NAD(P)-dependent oxidoreductase [Tenuifilaceae bacterium]|nr:SDR family NAD(P)-dependent oxidoreductase [Tenuifilaceae bacterium]
METVFYITGSSRGIGKALAELALNIEDAIVFGISRKKTISHKRYTHITTDLSNIENLTKFEPPLLANAKKVILVNNAGMLGEVAQYGKLASNTIAKTHTLNAIAPAILTNWIISRYSHTASQIVILNISSGAARYPVEGWGNYCSSKASVDMLTKVIALENNNDKIKTFAVAPGIVDTQMQKEIRDTKQENFPDLSRFIGYKENKQLSNVTEVAEMLMRIVNNPHSYKEAILDVRKLFD